MIHDEDRNEHVTYAQAINLLTTPGDHVMATHMILSCIVLELGLTDKKLPSIGFAKRTIDAALEPKPKGRA